MIIIVVVTIPGLSFIVITVSVIISSIINHYHDYLIIHNKLLQKDSSVTR